MQLVLLMVFSDMSSPSCQLEFISVPLTVVVNTHLKANDALIQLLPPPSSSSHLFPLSLEMKRLSCVPFFFSRQQTSAETQAEPRGRRCSINYTHAHTRALPLLSPDTRFLTLVHTAAEQLLDEERETGTNLRLMCICETQGFKLPTHRNSL